MNLRGFKGLPVQDNTDGLVFVGGELTVEQLIIAYKNGLFPWYSAGEPIMWWSPQKRSVLLPQDVHLSKSLKKMIAKNKFQCTKNLDFNQVIQRCAQVPRKNQSGTWITQEMISAYQALHQAGFAHSIEVYENTTLVGGLYGVSIGKCFFGESMFSLTSGASKVAFAYLVESLFGDGFLLIDCQLPNPHLEQFGVKTIRKELFLKLLANACK